MKRIKKMALAIMVFLVMSLAACNGRVDSNTDNATPPPTPTPMVFRQGDLVIKVFVITRTPTPNPYAM